MRTLLDCGSRVTLICVLISALGCGDAPTPIPSAAKATRGNAVVNDIKRNFNLRERSESGWHVAVWTDAGSYDIAVPVAFYVEIAPPAGFAGKCVVEAVIAAPTIGGGRGTCTVTETKEFPREHVPSASYVRIKDAFLSDTASGNATKPLNLGRHKVIVKVRANSGPTFTFDDLMVNVALMNH